MRHRYLRPAIAAVTIAINVPETVWAQAGAPPGDVGPVAFGEEIVVIGSRIPRKDAVAPGPVTILSREEIVASGRPSLGDLLQTLPAQGNAFNTGVNNGGDGSTRVSLRSLGAQRTLVLVNGRRWVPSGLGADTSVDLNSIPTSAIERVEILKDGASAIYGSDAIAGVVNVVTRRRVDGAEVSAYTGATPHGDGETYDVSAVAGVSGERAGLVVGGSFYTQKPIWSSARAWAALPVAYDQTGANDPLGRGLGEYTIGNGTVPSGTFSLAAGAEGRPLPNPSNDSRIAAYNALVTAYPGTAKFIRDPSAPLGWRPFVPYALAPQGDAYNYWPQNYLVTPQQRVSLFATGDVVVGGSTRAYAEAGWVHRASDQSLDPEPLVIGPGGVELTISKDSVYNPFGVDITAADRRMTEAGHRTFSQSVNTFRIVAGLDGTVAHEGLLAGWTWDTSLNFGRSTAAQAARGSFYVPALQDALGPSFIDAANGPQCGTPGHAIAGCVPLDLFGGAGTVPASALRPLAFDGSSYGTNQLVSVQASATGALFQSPLADRAAALAVGYEFRRVSGSFIPDAVTAAGLATGNQASPASGAYGVHELYGELSLPLVARAPLAELIEATLAARAFDYSTSGTNWTYKLGARWRPWSDATLRGTFSTAFRAPSIAELFLGQQDNFATVSDPCADAATAPRSCGTAAGNADDRTQLRSRIGGNPALQPETAETRTLGIVLEPRWARRLTITADWYRIAVDRAIGSVGEATILASCYPTDDGVAPRYCDLVARDPATGRIDSITNLQQNVGREVVAGVDVALHYGIPTVAGHFSFLVDATWLQQHDLTLADGTLVRGRGNYDLSIQGLGGMQGVNPAWKINAATGWSRGGLAAGASTRIIGSFTECGTPTGDYSGGGLCFVDGTYRREVPAWASWDAYVSYSLQGRAGRTTIAVGAQNLFDAAPPRIYNGFYAASDPTAYEFTGRFVYVRAAYAM
jgi:outer membrane receptor protein involved in Fe transport